MSFSFRKCSMCSVVSLGLLAGCAAADRNTDPEQVLAETVNQANANANFGFQGQTQIVLADASLQQGVSFEGYMAGKNKPVITKMSNRQAQAETVDTRSGESWNPVAALNAMVQNKQTVRLDPKWTDNVSIGLTVDVDPAALKQSLLQLGGPQGGDALDSDLARLQQKYGLSNAALRKWKQVAEARLTADRARYEEMMRTLDISGGYRLIVDRGTKLPSEFEQTTKLTYSSQGAPASEEKVIKYQFFNSPKDSEVIK